MANKYSDKPGHKNGAKSPSGIDNAEHHDLSGSKKVMALCAGTIDSISANSAVENAVQPRQIVRFFNTTGGTAFVWTGEAGSAPVTVDVTNGLAIGAGQELILAMGELVSGKSTAFKTSAAGVQAALLEV
jgi:hypothetical protein